MGRGPKKHLKRLAAPKSWMLDKLGGRFAARPSPGPHKLRECIPICVVLRNRLKYALTRKECMQISKDRLVKVDGRIRTDMNFPAGIMDVITLEKTNETFRVMYDAKGRFVLHRITAKEGAFKLCKVRKAQLGPKGIPYVCTHDGRTIRYPDPAVKAGDSVVVDIATGKITDHAKFEPGNKVFVTGGHNQGRVGIMTKREKHLGSFEIIHIEDDNGHEFATRVGNVFVIGKGNRELVSLPRGKGLKLSIVEEREARFGTAE